MKSGGAMPGVFAEGVGSSWQYQESSLINCTLKNGLQQQFHASYVLHGDKSTHPLFIICCGIGTGKSRLLDEFKQLAVKVTTENPDLNVKMKNL